jgi:esterase/lipase superfamily enzyme
MRALRVLSIFLAIALAPTAAAAQQPSQSMSADLVKDLRDVEVQKQLIAAGVLDAQAGLASRRELRTAIQWFRRAFKFQDSAEPMPKLTQPERAKLEEVYAKFVARTGLQGVVFKDPEGETKGTGPKNELRLLLPAGFVDTTFKKAGTKNQDEWWEYRASDGSIAIGPELYSATKHTPVSIFKRRILGVAIDYKHFHLTSDEFNARGDVGEEDGFFSYNLVHRSKDLLKGLFMRYAKRAPAGFTVPDFLEPILAADPEPEANLDRSTRGWRLLMQNITNLVAGEFPFDNGWTRVSSRDCALSRDAPDGQPKKVRILFGTDRMLMPQAKESAENANVDSLFGSAPGNRLNLGCAYVSVPPVEEGKGTARDLKKGATLDYRLFHTPKGFDLGDHLYLTGEIAESRDSAAALVFIHGYNVAFADALLTVAQVASATKYGGRVYMFSWPSAQSLTGYLSDLDNAEQAEPYFQAFMKLLMRDADINEIDILVHSMGSQAILRGLSALRSLFETVRRGSRRGRSIRIGQIIFAAPDVAMPVFDQKIQRIAPYADRVTVYASSTDAALLASRLLRSGTPRMGELDGNGRPHRIKVKNVHVIDATGSERWWRVDRILFGQGHDYFRLSPGVLMDIGRILKASRNSDRSTPGQRSPDLFDEEQFDAAAGEPPFYFWRLRK